MNYERIYENLVTRGKNRNNEGYTENHHIIPRCLGGTDDESNLVSLTPEEHYVAHQLLAKIYPNNFKLLSAANFMTTNTFGRKNKCYGWLKRRYAEFMTGDNNPNKNGAARRKYIEKNGIPEVSKEYITEEWCANISKRMMGSKNPCAGIKPWNHGRATDYTKSVWAKADEIRNIWEKNKYPSYCKLYSLANGRAAGKDWEAISPYMNLVKYFRKDWKPQEDEEWKIFVANLGKSTGR